MRQARSPGSHSPRMGSATTASASTSYARGEATEGQPGAVQVVRGARAPGAGGSAARAS
jgi:hypothetical protein